MSTEPRRRQADRRAATGTALLDAAGEIVVSHGVTALTLARVGQQAGYSRGIVTHHFGSKTALLEAFARRAQVGFVAGVEDAPPGLDRLLQLIDGYVAALHDSARPWQAFLLLWADAASNPELGPILRERDEQFRREIHEDVVAGIEDGTIRPDLDPPSIAVAVLGQLRGVALQYMLEPADVPLEKLGCFLTEHWRSTLIRPADR